MRAFNIVVIVCCFSCNARLKRKSDICISTGFNQHVEKVSFNDLENIKKMDGEFVEIDGVFRYAFEDVALYPSFSSNSKNALWISFTDSILSHSVELKENIDSRVVLIGKINLSNKGHYHSYMATLDSVFCLKAK